MRTFVFTVCGLAVSVVWIVLRRNGLLPILLYKCNDCSQSSRDGRPHYADAHAESIGHCETDNTMSLLIRTHALSSTGEMSQTIQE